MFAASTSRKVSHKNFFYEIVHYGLFVAQIDKEDYDNPTIITDIDNDQYMICANPNKEVFGEMLTHLSDGNDDQLGFILMKDGEAKTTFGASGAYQKVHLSRNGASEFNGCKYCYRFINYNPVNKQYATFKSLIDAKESDPDGVLFTIVVYKKDEGIDSVRNNCIQAISKTDLRFKSNLIKRKIDDHVSVS